MGLGLEVTNKCFISPMTNICVRNILINKKIQSQYSKRKIGQAAPFSLFATTKAGFPRLVTIIRVVRHIKGMRRLQVY